MGFCNPYEHVERQGEGVSVESGAPGHKRRLLTFSKGATALWKECVVRQETNQKRDCRSSYRGSCSEKDNGCRRETNGVADRDSYIGMAVTGVYLCAVKAKLAELKSLETTSSLLVGTLHNNSVNEVWDTAPANEEDTQALTLRYGWWVESSDDAA